MTTATPSTSEPGPGPSPAPIASLPSGAPIPAPSPSPPATTAKPIPLRAVLSALPSNADAFLARLNKCLSTPSGIDTVMLFLCYTSRLSASVLTGLSTSVLRRSAREWITLLLSTKAGTATVVTPAAPIATAAAAKALVVAARLRALSTLLSEARTILRLWALVGMYFWGKGLVVKALTPTKEGEEKQGTKTATFLEWARLLCCVGLQGLENGAYLSQRGVMGWTPKQQGLAYKWSARFWAAYIGIELGRLLAETTRPAVKAEGAQEETVEWRKKVARNMAWMPLTLHWSTDAGFVSEPVIGALASVPGIIQMRDLWASTK
ncbi:hypothetical protein QBC39DRAFT_364083 [Podospora conica]|nr:hypothetical protein QBC39DRAFT_364083 [Schizothecium conicum]